MPEKDILMINSTSFLYSQKIKFGRKIKFQTIWWTVIWLSKLLKLLLFTNVLQFLQNCDKWFSIYIKHLQVLCMVKSYKVSTQNIPGDGPAYYWRTLQTVWPWMSLIRYYLCWKRKCIWKAPSNLGPTIWSDIIFCWIIITVIVNNRNQN